MFFQFTLVLLRRWALGRMGEYMVELSIPGTPSIPGARVELERQSRPVGAPIWTSEITEKARPLLETVYPTVQGP